MYEQYDECPDSDQTDLHSLMEEDLDPCVTTESPA